MTGRTPQFFFSKQTPINRVIESPGRQFPDFKILRAHSNTSQ
jgi:hypothetical protein